MTPPPQQVLFLCTGNSARSILAEALAHHAGLAAESAGSRPTGAVHPQALALLAQEGLPTEGLRSKRWDEFAGRNFDLVVTVCDSAAQDAEAEACPVWSGAGRRLHWSLPDPAAADDVETAFRKTHAELVRRIAQLLQSEP